jgi:hypothetical protein
MTITLAMAGARPGPWEGIQAALVAAPTLLWSSE